MGGLTVSPWLDLAAVAPELYDRLEARGLRLLRVMADGEPVVVCAIVETAGDVMRAAASGLERRPDAVELVVFGVRPRPGNPAGAELERLVRFRQAVRVAA